MYEPIDKDQSRVLDLILKNKPIDYSDIDLCNTILEASMNWTDEDEVEHPALKVARVKAQYQVTAYEKASLEEEAW